MNLIDDQQFEPLVRDAMRARPEPASISNLAYRAIERARAQTSLLAREQLELWARIRRRNGWVAVAASVLIAVVVFVGVKKLSDAGLLAGSTTSVSSVDSTSSDTSSNSGGIAISATVALTAELLVVALILLSAGAASPRPEYTDVLSY
jgi:hypothetical protein